MFVFQIIIMSTILLSIGSNTFAKTNIDKAKRMLTYLFPNIVFSDPILSEPEDDNFKYLFRNILGCCTTDMNLEQVIDKVKLTERAVGRTSRDKYQGKVIIDIDILKYGDEVVRPQDLEKEYIQQLIAIFEIPEFVDTEENTETEESTKTQDTVETQGTVETQENIETQGAVETQSIKDNNADDKAVESKETD